MEALEAVPNSNELGEATSCPRSVTSRVISFAGLLLDARGMAGPPALKESG